MTENTDADIALPASPEVIERLVASHREFLSFLQPRVPSRAVAEEILQAAFVKTLEKGGTIRDSESSVAWFYRVLRNALIDFYRRNASELRAVEAQIHQSDLSPEPELHEAICGCMHMLLPTLKSEYAEMIRRIDLEEEAVATVASDLQISVNNATVRLHRARQVLKQQLERSCGTCATHGCLNCSCGSDRC